jgi:hypothetical protein
MYDFGDMLFAFIGGSLVGIYITSSIYYHCYKKRPIPPIDTRTYLAGQIVMGYLSSNIYTGQVAALNAVRVADLVIKELHDNPGESKT